MKLRSRGYRHCSVVAGIPPRAAPPASMVSTSRTRMASIRRPRPAVGYNPRRQAAWMKSKALGALLKKCSPATLWPDMAGHSVPRLQPNVAETPASVGRQPIGALSRRLLFRPSADFTEGDIANSSRKCRACGEPAGLRRPLASRYAITGYTEYTTFAAGSLAGQSVFRFLGDFGCDGSDATDFANSPICLASCSSSSRFSGLAARFSFSAGSA